MLEENWIPVGERLPEIFKGAYSEMVLVSIMNTGWDEEDEEYGLDQFHVGTAYLVGLSSGSVVWKSRWDDLTEEHYDLVTHWMPLPKPMCVEA